MSKEDLTKEDLSWEEKQWQAKERKQREIKDAIALLFGNLNKMGNEREIGELVVNEIRSQHRTLQQVFFGNVLKPVIMDFAKRDEENLHDLRNEAACKCATKLKGVLEESYFPFI